jgi:glutathione-independent formaldehyde dehydrogenase
MMLYADFDLLKFPDKNQAMEKIRDLTCLSDILPIGYHGAVMAGVGPGATVYTPVAGPVGLACAAACHRPPDCGRFWRRHCGADRGYFGDR